MASLILFVSSMSDQSTRGRRLFSYLIIPLVVLLRIASHCEKERNWGLCNRYLHPIFLESWVTKIPVANEEELKVFVPSRIL